MAPASLRPAVQRAYFPVARGLIEPEHHTRIGSSIWVYLCILRHQTSSTGEVNHRRPITAADIGGPLGFEERMVRRHLDRLENAGYLTVEIVAGEGYRIWINKPLAIGHESRPTVTKNVRGSGPATPDIFGQSRAVPRTEMSGVGPVPRTEMSGVSIEGSEGVRLTKVKDWRARAITHVQTLRDFHQPGYLNPDAVSYCFGMLVTSPHYLHVPPETFAERFHAAVLCCENTHGARWKSTDLFAEVKRTMEPEEART